MVWKEQRYQQILCGFKKLSKTIKVGYAIPRTDDSIHLLAAAKFTKPDLRRGCWQVEIEDMD